MTVLVRSLLWSAVVGLWLWLPLDLHIDNRLRIYADLEVLPEPTLDWLVPAGRTLDPQMWKNLEGIEEVEVRDEKDSLLFRGTPEALRTFLASQPTVPASEPLLPTTGVEHGP